MGAGELPRNQDFPETCPYSPSSLMGCEWSLCMGPEDTQQGLRHQSCQLPGKGASCQGCCSGCDCSPEQGRASRLAFT